MLSIEWVDLVKTGIAKNVESPSIFGEKLRANPTEGSYFNDYCNWRQIEEFRDYVARSKKLFKKDSPFKKWKLYLSTFIKWSLFFYSIVMKFELQIAGGSNRWAAHEILN